jgi:hypothetical protein
MAIRSEYHCLHIKDDWTRYCCWCDLTQHRVFGSEPCHGLRYTGERFPWHWEPSSMDKCPGELADQEPDRGDLRKHA